MTFPDPLLCEGLLRVSKLCCDLLQPRTAESMPVAAVSLEGKCYEDSTASSGCYDFSLPTSPRIPELRTVSYRFLTILQLQQGTEPLYPVISFYPSIFQMWLLVSPSIIPSAKYK